MTISFIKNYEGDRDTLWIYFVLYNFCRTHASLGQIPSQAAGLAKKKYNMAWILDPSDRLGDR